MSAPSSLVVRPASQLDLEDIYQIELTSPSPWSIASLYSEISHVNSLILVAVLKQQVVGWCCGRVIAPETELLKIAVHPNCRRRGVAGHLLGQFELKLAGKNITDVYLEVRSQNKSAIKFYLKFGFFQVGLRSKYYSSPQDDALIYKKEINTGQENKK